MTLVQEKPRIAIYTAIFGKKDALHEPKFIPSGCDFICYTDQPFTSKVWQIRKVAPPVAGDGTRSNRWYKILPHKHLPEYEFSVYVDGNISVRGDVAQLVDEQLCAVNYAVFNHANNLKYPYKGLKDHLWSLRRAASYDRPEDNMEIVEAQAKQYFAEGFPDSNGLAWNLVLLRRHHASDVIEAMEAWWNEVTNRSKRDQMSFNYVAWKSGLKFNYIPGDPTDNEYFYRTNHFLPIQYKIRSYVRGAIKRLKHGGKKDNRSVFETEKERNKMKE